MHWRYKSEQRWLFQPSSPANSLQPSKSVDKFPPLAAFMVPKDQRVGPCESSAIILECWLCSQPQLLWRFTSTEGTAFVSMASGSHSLSAPSSTVFLNFGGGELLWCWCPVYGWPLYWHLVSALWLVVILCIKGTLLQKEASLMKTESCFALWV